jgi:CubicO group peptidase (beta-lactamase class C family)
VFLVGLAALACQTSPKQTTTAAATAPAMLSPGDTPWPTSDWLTAAPEDQGMDTARLDDMLDHIEQQRLSLHSLLIVRHGYIVSETYYPPYKASTRHELYSVTKSFTATLVGIALDQGLIKSLDEPVMAYFPDQAFENDEARKQAMRLEDLLTMTSGLDWLEGDSTYRAMYVSRDWVQYVMDEPMVVEPGSQFLYCSGCSHVLSAIVQSETGMNTRDFAEKYLFAPLGIKDADWDTDSQDIPIGGWGLHITPRDMARLGYLYLHQGEWAGEQVVSARWVESAARKHTDTDGELDYGYQWWIHPRLGGYTALGRYGQTIFVIPELDLIVVTTAQVDDHDPIFDLIEQYIIPAAR